MTLISQAGFSLGLAAVIARSFDWGRQFQAVIISCVIVNQLIGPPLCKLAMKWSGESGKASGQEALHEAENDPHARKVADDNKVTFAEIFHAQYKTEPFIFRRSVSRIRKSMI